MPQDADSGIAHGVLRNEPAGAGIVAAGIKDPELRPDIIADVGLREFNSLGAKHHTQARRVRLQHVRCQLSQVQDGNGHGLGAPPHGKQSSPIDSS